MNVSPQSDAEFVRLLEIEDPERYAGLMKNMRRANPVMRMSEDQALTNFMLGLSTGQYRFEVLAGEPAPTSRDIDVGVAERIRTTRKRIRQARAGRESTRTAKSVAVNHTN